MSAATDPTTPTNLGGVTVVPSATSSLGPAASTGATPSSTPTPTVARTTVLWVDYAAGTQAEIDRMTTAKDCQGIQSFFGMATATEESVRARTGHGKEALVAYLNEALATAACV